MNKLLPNIEDLTPIEESRKTFYDSGFNNKFNLLSFEKQLQIINDIVRQTMIYSKYPNPKDDIETLIGDSYTAALVSINYLKYLKIGYNHRIVFARKRPFELEDSNSKKVVVLVDDNCNNTYLFDATPIVDYKCGYVEKINNKQYNEYIPINGELKRFYEYIRKIKYDCSKGTKEIKRNIENIKYALENDIFKDDIKEIYNLLEYNYPKYINENNYKQKSKINEYLKQLSIELNDLISSDNNYKRQIELAQLITKLTTSNNINEKIVYNIGKNKCLMSQLSPRWFLENGLTLVMIKPSAYIFNWQNDIRNLFLESKYNPIGEYKGGLGYSSPLGLKRMRLFHPHGYQYERSMAGPTDIFLVERQAEDIGKIKKQLRQEYKKKVLDKEVMWFDGELIEWNPICLNFAHSSDDPCEAAMGYTAMYPESQLMTRFMYPNPRLIKEEKNARVRI